MGRIPNSGQGKAFEGTPTSIHDNKSIQKAIKGTISDESLATKNLNTLAGLGRLDMFYPKRSNAPIDTAQFRNYPLPTIIFSNIDTTKTGSSGSWDVDVNFSISVNHYLGFDAKLDIECTVNLDNSFTQTQTRYIAKKEINLRSVSTTGMVNNTFQFSFEDVPNNTSGSDDVDVNISAMYTPQDSTIGTALSPSGGGSAYYDPAPVITQTVGAVQQDNPFVWNAIEVDSTNDCNFNTVGSTFSVYTRQSTLSIGMKIYANANGDTTVSTTKLRLDDGGSTAYIIQLNISKEIVSIVECATGLN